MRVTSQDVAREVGVSQTAVSFVLNGRTDQGISESTRLAVLEAVERLGYVPMATARSLRSGRSSVVLCVLPDLPVARALEEFKVDLTSALRGLGYTCIFARVTSTKEGLSSILRDVTPAVVLVLGTLRAADRKILKAAGIPALDGILDAARPDGPGVDQASVGALQIQHLAERGHTRIAYGIIDDPLEIRFAEPRLLGAQRTCAALGLEPLSVKRVAMTRASVRDAAQTWSTHEVTAIAAFNDDVALALLSVLRSMKIRVPEDIALIGVDDLPLAALVDPPLSTIRINLELAANVVTDRVLQLIQGETAGTASKSAAFTELVHRETT